MSLLHMTNLIASYSISQNADPANLGMIASALFFWIMANFVLAILTIPSIYQYDTGRLRRVSRYQSLLYADFG